MKNLLNIYTNYNQKFICTFMKVFDNSEFFYKFRDFIKKIFSVLMEHIFCHFLTLDNYASKNYKKYYKRFYSRQFYMLYEDSRINCIN